VLLGIEELILGEEVKNVDEAVMGKEVNDDRAIKLVGIELLQVLGMQDHE